MNKLQKELKFVPLILAIMGIVSIILFLAFPVAYINNALYDGGINGFSSVFGLSVKIGSTLTLNFSPINGVGLTILILVLLASLCSGFMSKYGRGFYIFSTILLIVAVAFTCSYHASWIRLNVGGGAGKIPAAEYQCGAGQVLAAALMIVQGIGNIIAFRLFKKN